MSEAATVLYKRATFVTHLPVGHRYTATHCWLDEVSSTASSAEAGPRWRVGFTRFALRMLGEIVEVQFEKKTGDAVAPGDVLGSIEGFKALSDIFCVGRGTFNSGNAGLREGLDQIARDPYNGGWLYEFSGHPDNSLDVNSYRDLLDATIDRLLAKQKQEESS